MCVSDLSPQDSPRPAASTVHPTEGTPAGEDYPAGHCWPGLHWPNQAREEGYSEELGNDRGQGGTICTLQVFISHGQPGVQLGLTLKSEMALKGLQGGFGATVQVSIHYLLFFMGVPEAIT